MATIKSITSHDMNGETELSKFLLAKQYLFQEHGHDISEITNATTKDEHEELKKEHDTLRTEHDTLRSEHDTLRDDHNDLALKHEDLDARHYKLLNDFNEVKKKVLILQKYIMTQLDSTREMLTKIDKDDEDNNEDKKKEDDKKNEENTNETTQSSINTNESQSSSI